ncbi:MAG: metal-dependent transcriptional regulator [Candidatus Omnitrophota bacterium]|jgi:DtxR family Mn-dependent transcriptional regulator
MHLVKELTPAMEGYLEAVLMLEEKKQPPRVKTISDMMHVTKPTVHSAIVSLVELGYLRHENYGHIELTSEGKAIAEDVYRRHKALTKFLKDILRVNPKLAEKEACGMEHAMSNETLAKLTQFIEFLEIHSEGKANQCLSRFYEYSKNGKVRPYRQCKGK